MITPTDAPAVTARITLANYSGAEMTDIFCTVSYEYEGQYVSKTSEIVTIQDSTAVNKDWDVPRGAKIIDLMASVKYGKPALFMSAYLIQYPETTFRAKLVTSGWITGDGPDGGGSAGLIAGQIKQAAKYAVWEYKANVIQQNVAGGSLLLKITPGAGNELKPLHGSMGPNDYAANRTLTVRFRDDEDYTLTNLIEPSTADNSIVTLCYATVNAATGGVEVNISDAGWILRNTDYLAINAASLAEDEELDLSIRCLVTAIPTVSWADSGGTEDVTTTHNRII